MTEFVLPFSIFCSYVAYFSTRDSCFSTTGVKMPRRLLDHLELYFQKRSFKRFGREPNRLHSSVNRRVVRGAWPVLGIIQDARDVRCETARILLGASGPPYFMESQATLTFCSPIGSPSCRGVCTMKRRRFNDLGEMKACLQSRCSPS
jgi:hypothetical protein